MAQQQIPGIDPTARPTGDGCAECLAGGGWWFHLRRCAQCGNIGCCDSSPAQHATRHARESGHPFLTSFEPGESWFWNVETERYLDGPELAPPTSHPVEQPAPGPQGMVPDDWQSRLH
ncbi:UBP-type zinc finger domain-containing protein [Streptomyces sp. RerS4]|uniref:UBP-type zinc finger domain-containing protein n=1 Tax=Streptomyces sp. RerS4 TaxID=2942449 RepID=UPI00201BD078|nr:UBP-type zinc finger domain-containing protein [Streptomyces sp. RerS4]UQX01291.1 UBP-type zinc finger domain-containing protein [Streptomyces sp. RerS4]